MKRRVNYREAIEANLDDSAARQGYALVVLAGRRAWESWCARGHAVPTQPEGEWLALDAGTIGGEP